ncbi:DUF305 domain-containing protein [Daejeonella lutea]|uniref:Uncharacterized conserved protein, DUF305 family n=1 Tax=Daejeonella lutea TaxID=572036 RepID=A0A1T5B4R7_9SPHI|nr:DUF305 domain-containing protein [Daejeonella lutea]SKB42216.1 Uncharacterized conserved protein, DUF305 family [Daejeonella lutea]
MKISTIKMAAFATALVFSSCQNNTSTSDTHDSTIDTHDMEVGAMPMNSGMQQAMDKMMTDMHQMKMTGNVDYDFAMMMKSHHQAAVDMSQAELESGKDEEVKKMAQNIIDAQKKEINDLQAFLDKHKNPEKNYDPAMKDQGFAKMMDQNMTMMMDMPKMDSTSSTDKHYVQMMIPHHEGAVQMAEGFVQFGKDAVLISMAKKMIADQKKEIEQFKNWTE